jgi:hypothetical protein
MRVRRSIVGRMLGSPLPVAACHAICECRSDHQQPIGRLHRPIESTAIFESPGPIPEVRSRPGHAGVLTLIITTRTSNPLAQTHLIARAHKSRHARGAVNGSTSTYTSKSLQRQAFEIAKLEIVLI